MLFINVKQYTIVNIYSNSLSHSTYYSESSPANTLHKQLHQSVFMSAMSPFPAKDLPLCWEQHSKLLPGVASISCSTVAKWTMDEVADFVRKLPGCLEHATKFSDEVRHILLLFSRIPIYLMVPY